MRVVTERWRRRGRLAVSLVSLVVPLLMKFDRKRLSRRSSLTVDASHAGRYV